MSDNPTIAELLRRGKERHDTTEREAERSRSMEAARRGRDYDLLRKSLQDWMGEELAGRVELPPFGAVPITFGVGMVNGRMVPRPGVEGRIRVPRSYAANYDELVGPVGEPVPDDWAEYQTIEDAVFAAYEMEAVREKAVRELGGRQAEHILGPDPGCDQDGPDDSTEPEAEADHERSKIIPF